MTALRWRRVLGVPEVRLRARRGERLVLTPPATALCLGSGGVLRGLALGG